MITDVDIRNLALLEKQAAEKGSGSVEFTQMMTLTKKLLNKPFVLLDLKESEKEFLIKMEELRSKGKTINEAAAILGVSGNKFYKVINKTEK
jgi:hypothetical protein